MGFISKAWKKVKKIFKKAAPAVGAVVGSLTPLGPVAGSAIGAYLGSVVAGNNTRQHLFSAGAAAVGGYAGGSAAGAGGNAASQTGTEIAKEAGKQAVAQGVTQTGTQAAVQTGTQVTAQEATKATFTQGVKQFATKHAASIGAASGAASGVSMGTTPKMPSVDNTEETELLQREKEYEKRKRSSLFETKGGAAGERVGYTGSENRGSIFGN